MENGAWAGGQDLRSRLPCKVRDIHSRQLLSRLQTSRRLRADRQRQQASKLSSPAAEGQGAKVAVDGRQQRLCAGEAQGHVAHIEVLHVVADLQVLTYIPLACRQRAGAHRQRRRRQLLGGCRR